MSVALIHQEEPLETLATHCIAARAVIEHAGTSVMRQLIDLLLFEIGVALAEKMGQAPPPQRRE